MSPLRTAPAARPRPIRRAVAVAALVVAAAAPAAAAPQVVDPDGRPLDRATVVADGIGAWVRQGPSLPVRLDPDGDDRLRLPTMATARLLVLDASTGSPITGGQLRWLVDGLPENVAAAAWRAPDGRLDLGCRGGEEITLTARGYRPERLTLAIGPRRHTVLLAPRGGLEIALEPPAGGTLYLAAAPAITVFRPFFDIATKHPIGSDGTVRVTDLDAAVEHRGVVVVPGRAPVVGRIPSLPRRLELRLDPGLGLTGRVLDRDGTPLEHARVRATGRIDELGGFRYRQQTRTGADGAFAVGGLLPGEILVEACAQARACARETVSVDGTAPAAPLTFKLVAGRDVALQVLDELDRPVRRATVIDTGAFRRHTTDDDGRFVFEGLEPATVLELEVRGDGVAPWRGRIGTDEPTVVLRLALGGALEWPILVDRDIPADEVRTSWFRLNRQGREVEGGTAEWDARLRLVRASGLDGGRYRLEVRLPGAATMVSEAVELAPGEQRSVSPAIPERGLAIAGRVIDENSFQPVAGARVTCEPGSPSVFRDPKRLQRLPSALSDADGVFLLEGLDPGRCRAVVRAPGYAAWRRDGVEPDEIGADLGDIELGAGMTVVGRVVDRSGRPQTGIDVEIAEDAAYAYVPDATVRTDHGGWFRADGLAAGAWAVTARRGEETARSTAEGRSGDTVEVELRLGGLRLEGEVWLGDRPAPGGRLVLTTDRAWGDGMVVMVQTEADERRFFGVDQPPVAMAVAGDGRFAADGVSPGVYTASYTPPEPGASPVSRELVVPQTELHRCLLRFADAGVDGVVLDPDGFPVAGAVVAVRDGDGAVLASGFSDGDGGFAFVGLEPGPVRLGAVHGEFADAEPVVAELRSGRRVGPVTLELGQPDGAELSLEVTAGAGSLSGAPVHLVGMTTMTGFTDGLGVASFTGIEPGRYRACAAAYGGAVGCGPEIELDDGDRRRSTLELGRGGRVEVLLGPMERVPALRLLTADGIDLTSMLMMVSPPIPGREGIALGPLRADDYRIVVDTAAGPRQGTIATLEGEVVELDLR